MTRSRVPVVSLLLGGTAATGALALGGFCLLAQLDAARAFEAMRFVLEHSPVPLRSPPDTLARQAVQWSSGLVLPATLLLVVGVSMLHSARALLPPWFGGDRWELVLAPGERRVGRPLAGLLKSKGRPTPGGVFVIRVSCKRRYRSGDRDREEVAFTAQCEARLVERAGGRELPFRIEIPAYTPPSAMILMTRGHHWTLEVFQRNGGSPTEFDVSLGAAPKHELEALEAAEVPAQREKLDAIEGALPGIGLPPHYRQALRQLRPEQLAEIEGLARRLSAWFGISWRAVLGCLGVALLFFLALLALSRFLP